MELAAARAVAGALPPLEVHARLQLPGAGRLQARRGHEGQHRRPVLAVRPALPERRPGWHGWSAGWHGWSAGLRPAAGRIRPAAGRIRGWLLIYVCALRPGLGGSSFLALGSTLRDNAHVLSLSSSSSSAPQCPSFWLPCVSFTRSRHFRLRLACGRARGWVGFTSLLYARYLVVTTYLPYLHSLSVSYLVSTHGICTTTTRSGNQGHTPHTTQVCK